LIIAFIGKLAYRLELPQSMYGIHNVFHVSMLLKYLHDLEQKVELEPIIIEQDITIKSYPVRIFKSSDCVLRRKVIKYIKVLWSNQTERSNMGT